jgi:Mn2+/Fe2+ NRAMP family transporter
MKPWRTAYFGTVMVVEIPWPEAARSFLLPTFRPDVAFWTTVVAVLGTTVSPYLFFWQAAQEVEDIRVEPERKQRTLSSFQRRSKAHVRAIVEAVAALGAQPAVLEFKVLQALHLPRSGCLPTVMQFI